MKSSVYGVKSKEKSDFVYRMYSEDREICPHADPLKQEIKMHDLKTKCTI